MAKFEGTRCDECRKIKEESNHWYQIGVSTEPDSHRTNAPVIRVEIGNLQGPEKGEDYEILDLCGEGCLQKQLMGLIPTIQMRRPN